MRGLLPILLLVPGCTVGGIRYRLDRGETFTIVGVVEKEILDAQRAVVQKMEIRFALDCEVTAVLPADEVRIACRLARIAVQGELRGRPFSYDSTRVSPDGPPGEPAQRYHDAAGERFDVRKSLYGPVREVIGGTRIEAAMGVPLKAVLSWFGGSFPRDGRSEGCWDETDRWRMAADFVGLPLAIQDDVVARSTYTHDGTQNGHPRIRLVTDYRSSSAKGRGEGVILYDAPTGKVYLSKRQATFTVGKLTVNLRAAAAHSEAALGE